MIYAWIDGGKRQPIAKGERTVCKDCGGLLTSVMPAQNVKHWRHKAGDCDRWAEAEGPWHLGWKEQFDLSLDLGARMATVDGHDFEIVHFASRSSQFIEKWKRSSAHVFFDCQGHIFYLANEKVAARANGGLPLKKGYFAYSRLSREDFIRAVHGAG